MDNATAALARMNMILHDCPTAEIWQDNTLADPHFKDGDGALKTFDFVVANPPFSDKAWSNGFDPAQRPVPALRLRRAARQERRLRLPAAHPRARSRAPAKARCILPHGVLFRGNAEAAIRRKLVQRGYIKGIIGLPANLFYGTGIPACIIVLDKENAAARKGIFMIDASKGFIKDGNKNRLRAQDIHRSWTPSPGRPKCPRYSRMVPLAEIADPKNDFNLNLPRYIDSTEPEDLQDIDAHLRGGIPDRDIDALGALLGGLARRARRACSSRPTAPATAQLQRPHRRDQGRHLRPRRVHRVQRSQRRSSSRSGRRPARRACKGIAKDGHPKALIETLAEDLLATFQSAPLLDAYDVYQHLMDYWAETMQDDCYLIAADGWREAAQPASSSSKTRTRRLKAEARLHRRQAKFKAELIPPALVIARYFAEEQRAIEDARSRARRARAAAGGNGRGTRRRGRACSPKSSKARATRTRSPQSRRSARLKEIGRRPGRRRRAPGARSLRSRCSTRRPTPRPRSSRPRRRPSTAKVAAKYAKLTEDEIKTLVVDDKWLATLAAAVQGELDRVSQTLTGRIRQLAERYATPLPQLTDEVATLAARVDGHLKKMGAVWK